MKAQIFISPCLVPQEHTEAMRRAALEASLVMACKNCGLPMIRCTECKNCGAWCR